MGRFIVDFYCPAAKLVVEIDGPVHLTQREADTERTRCIEVERGCRVLRFTNDQVQSDAAGVVEAIRMALLGPSA